MATARGSIASMSISDSESWPTLSVMFPLPTGHGLKASTLETLQMLTRQLQRLQELKMSHAAHETKGAEVLAGDAGDQHGSKSARGNDDRRERVQLIILGSKPLCEER